MLTGGKGSNIFTLNASSLLNIETIKDYDQGNQISYNVAEGDVIDLSALTNAAYLGGQALSTYVRMEQDSSGLFSWLEIKTSDTNNQWQKIAQLTGVNAGDLVSFDVGTSGANIHQSLAVPNYQTNWSISPSGSVFDESAGTITFTATRVDTTSAETVYASTSGTYGNLNSSDFNAIVGTPLVFAVGQTTQTFTVHINNDAIAEAYETFGIVIHSQLALTATDVIGSTTFTIKDNDVLSNNTFTAGADFTSLNMATGSHAANMLAGNDTAIVDYSTSITAIYTGSVTNGIYFSDGTHIATLTNVENYVVLGGSNADTIYAGAGNDTLIGGDGGDYLNVGTGQ